MMPGLRSIAMLVFVTAACAPQTQAADAEHPVVVELFQSQGCSSCPPANANLNAIADRPDVLALSFAVTYWDRLGWKDTFAHPRFTERQRAYSKAGGGSNVSTPQMIINGRGVLVGNRPNQIATYIRQFDRGTSGPALTPTAGKIKIGNGKTASPATVWLVLYDPRTRNVPIRAGENGGRTLPHRNIVRSLERLGQWNGTSVLFALPPPRDPSLKSAIIVQQGPGGPIVAARKV